MPHRKVGQLCGRGILMALITGYHGTSLTRAEAMVDRREFVASTRPYDWLGRGIYFFEDGPIRARVWARHRWKGTVERPAVVRAAINLDRCLDLFDTRAHKDLREKYPEFVSHERLEGVTHNQAGLMAVGGCVFTTASPEIDPAKRPEIQNFRDRAFIDWYVDHLQLNGIAIRSVRGIFLDGRALFPASFLFDWAHAQIAVIDETAIEDISLQHVDP